MFKFARAKGGNVTALSAALFGGASFMIMFAVDLGTYERQSQRIQFAADAAALGFGALIQSMEVRDRRDFQCPTQAARKVMAAHGYPNARVQTKRIKTRGQSFGCSVKVEADAKSMLTGGLRLSPKKVRAEASVTFEGQAPICVLALNQKDAGALDLSDAARLASECALQVNSNDREAVDLGDQDHELRQLCVVGGIDGLSASERAALGIPLDCARVNDPVRHLRNTPTSTCDYTDLTLTQDDIGQTPRFSSWKDVDVIAEDSGGRPFDPNIDSWIDAEITLSPGVYCGGVKAADFSKLKFTPGLYVIKDGVLDIDGVGVTGKDVTFALKGESTVNLRYWATQTTAAVSLRAPETGPYAGVLFGQLRRVGKSQTSTFSSGFLSGMEGLIYLPDHALHIDARNEPSLTPGAFKMLITDTVRIAGKQDVRIAFDRSSTNVPWIGSSYTSGHPRLVH